MVSLLWRQSLGGGIKGRWIDFTNPLRRPEAHDGFANNVIARDKTPVTTVIAIIAVITHHQIRVRWYGDGPPLVHKFLSNILFSEEAIVDIHSSSFNLYLLSR